MTLRAADQCWAIFSWAMLADLSGYGQKTWDEGSDKPYFASLFGAIRDGTAFGGAGASLDLDRLVVSGYGNLQHSRLYSTPHAPCDMPDVVPMGIGC